MASHTFHRPNRPLALYAGAFAVFIYLPILFIPLFSFNSGWYVKFPLESFTFHWYVDLFQREQLMRALWNSIKVALFVSVFSTLIAIPAALAVARYRMPGKSFAISFIMLPLILPGVVMGTAILGLLNWFDVTLSLVTVTIGQCVICLPYAIAVLLPRFIGVGRALEEASADLGEPPLRTFLRVTLPIAMPGVLACLLMTFTISFEEYFMAFFLGGKEITLPIYIWTQLRFPDDFPSLLALATLIITFSFVLVFASLRLARVGESLTQEGAR
ncbi:MAG: ABC transporter permease [Nitrospiraceae bacterium]|nr:ABC transporter permease [Nitrospiraceae bacterium]